MASRTQHTKKKSNSAFQQILYFSEAFNKALDKKVKSVSEQTGAAVRASQVIKGIVAAALRKEGYLAKGKE